MAEQVFECERCHAYFPAEHVQHDQCPHLGCGGTMKDITNTARANEFLQSIGRYAPKVVAYSYMNKRLSTNYGDKQ